MKEVVIDNYSKWKIVIDIYYANIKGETNRSSLARTIHLSPYHPYLSDVLDFLKKENIIIMKFKDLNIKIFTIDNNRLHKLVGESRLYKEFLRLAEYRGSVLWESS